MIKLLLPVFVLLSSNYAVAQNDSIRKYLDGDLNFTTKRDFVYTGMAVKSNDHWMLYAVYPDTSRLLKVFYKNAALTIKDGSFELYHPKNVLAQQGNFVNNIPEGHWKAYFQNGQPEYEGDLVHNHFSGVWQSWYSNGNMKTSSSYLYDASMVNGDPTHENAPGKVQKVLDDFTPEGKLEGAATTWYPNGNKESVVNYHNDSLTGLCSWYRENGTPSTTEVYVNGKVNELECYDSFGKYSGATCSIMKLPLLIHPFFTAIDYIENELHNEKHSSLTTYGDAQVRFTVAKNGSIRDLQVLSSPDASLSRRITEIFAGMPKWSPAITHNREIDYPITLVIPYYGN